MSRPPGRIETARRAPATTEDGTNGGERTAAAEPVARRPRRVLVVAAAGAVALTALGPFGPAFDGLNLLGTVGAIYLGLCLVRLDRTFGPLAHGLRTARRGGRFRASSWVLACLATVLWLVAAELLLRAGGLHRALVYERRGDLLFTPVPNQEYVEKISLTRSHINEHGLRGGPLSSAGRRRIVLCLGDSITYGYGLNDASAYPAKLQRVLDAGRPGQVEVLNGGVNAYPMALIHQKFLYLWGRGIRPDIVIVGYSMNEGWLGRILDGDEQTKAAFEQRVRWKNRARGIALYNVVLENWARVYYDLIKTRLVPGTHATGEEADDGSRYEAMLERMVADLRARAVTPVFLLFASFDGRSGRFESTGSLQQRFAAVADRHRIALLRSDVALRAGRAPDADLAAYFLDHGHLSERGADELAGPVAALVGQALEGNAPGRREGGR